MESVGVPVSRAVQREILLAGIADTQGSIHANDAKCSAALITHGLLFAAMVGIVGASSGLYPDAPAGLRVIALSVAGLVLACFLISTLCLLRAVRPYAPLALSRRIAAAHAPAGVFFPIIDRDKTGAEVSAQMTRLAELDDARATLDLVCETVKLAAIRRHEADWARRGYTFLMMELVLVVLFISLVGSIALVGA